MEPEQDIATFDLLATKTREQIEESPDASADWLQRAIDTTAERLAALGTFTREEGARAGRFLKRDLASLRTNFVLAGETIQLNMDPSRLSGGFTDLAAHLFNRTGNQFHEWAARSEEALEFNTGEVTGPGTLTCTDCGTKLHLKRSSHIPPCPKCHKTDFRKSY
jgi:Zinc-ribbon containing domain